MKKITLLCLSVLFSLTTLAQTDSGGAALDTSGGTDYYVQFGRADGTGNQGVMQDMGANVDLRTKKALADTDSQLWSITIRGGKHVFTNKLGREVGHNGTHFQGTAADTGVTFDIILTGNETYPGSYELQRDGDTQNMNQEGGGGFNKRLAQWNLNDPGNALKIIKQSDALDATIGVVGGLDPASTSVLPELDTYYYIQFTPGKGVLDSNGTLVSTGYAHENDDNQQWKITGTAGNYTITNKAGNVLEYDGFSNFTAAAGGTTTFGLVENAPNWEIQRSGASGALNQSGGSGFGKTIAEWNVGDVNNVLTFVLPSDIVYSPKISDGVVADNYYRIKFLSSNNYIQDMGDAVLARTQVLDADNDAQLWKVTGSEEAMVLVSKNGLTLEYDEGLERYISTSSPTPTSLALKVSQNDTYPNGWEIERVGGIDGYGINQFGGGANAELGEWGIGDQNNPLIFTQDTSVSATADTSGADLDTSGNTYYYIQFGRADGDGNQGVIQDMGVDTDLLTAQALVATDSQLWNVTIRGDKQVFTNKLGREIGHNGSLFQATAANTGVIFDILATTNPLHPDSYELKRDGDAQHVNQNGGGGFDRTLGQWNANDQGNPLKFIKEADATDAVIGVVGGLLSGEPARLTEDDFDAYTAGSFDGQFTAGEWEGWGGPSNADVSTDYAVSGANSLKVWDNAGTLTDAVALLEPITTGSKTITMMQYIPSTGGGAYYHLMGDYIDGGALHVEAALYFSTTVGEFSAADGVVTTFTATPDTWVEQKFVLDYDNGVGQFYYGGTLVKEYALAGSVDSIDFYATTISGAVAPSLAYYDNFLIAETVPAIADTSGADLDTSGATDYYIQFGRPDNDGNQGVIQDMGLDTDLLTAQALEATDSQLWSVTIRGDKHVFTNRLGREIGHNGSLFQATAANTGVIFDILATTNPLHPDSYELKRDGDAQHVNQNGGGGFDRTLGQWTANDQGNPLKFIKVADATDATIGVVGGFPAIARLTEDDFDAYTAGSFDGQFTAGEWEGWGGPSNADVSTDYAVSGTNSLKVWDNAGTLTDAVALLGPITTGSKTITMMQYIPSTGGGAYYHLMGDYIDGGALHVEAALYFSTTVGEFSAADGVVTTFTATPDTWVEQKFVLDYDNGVGQFYYGGTLVKEYALAGSVDSIDFYATTISGAVAPSLAYYDNFLIAETVPAIARLTEDDFEAYTAGSFDGQFTAGEWEGWGGPSNADVSTDYAVSGTNSLKVWDNAGTLTDAVALLEPITTGSKTITMMQYIPSTGGGAYYHLMGDYIDGGALHVEAALYFSTTVGEFSAADGVVTTFTATPDTWVEQKFVLDYDNGVGQFYYGGTLVKEYALAGSVDSIDFYATTISGAVAPSLAYYDDFLIAETTLSTVNDELFTGAFGIYPNPTTGIANLKLEMDNASDVNVAVFNILGKLLQSSNYTNVTNRTHSIDLSNQPNGIYFVRLTTNGQTETKKVIVNK